MLSKWRRNINHFIQIWKKTNFVNRENVIKFEINFQPFDITHEFNCGKLWLNSDPPRMLSHSLFADHHKLFQNKLKLLFSHQFDLVSPFLGSQKKHLFQIANQEFYSVCFSFFFHSFRTMPSLIFFSLFCSVLCCCHVKKILKKASKIVELRGQENINLWNCLSDLRWSPFSCETTFAISIGFWQQ